MGIGRAFRAAPDCVYQRFNGARECLISLWSDPLSCCHGIYWPVVAIEDEVGLTCINRAQPAPDIGIDPVPVRVRPSQLCRGKIPNRNACLTLDELVLGRA